MRLRVVVTFTDSKKVEGFIEDGILVLKEPIDYARTLEIAEGRASVEVRE